MLFFTATMDVFPKSMTSKQAVISTLAYFDLFGIPLTRAEISEYLFFKEPDDPKIDIYLRESPLIHSYDGYYSLKGNEGFYLDFFAKMKRSKLYWKRVKRFQWLFSICPYIELVCVCNSLPLRDVEENSDIDLFVVTEKDKLFTARFFLTLFTSILRIRRHGRKVRKRFCLSFYVSESKLNLENISLKPYDLYLAYWLKTLQPISGDYEIYEEAIKINSKWLKAYFHNRLPQKKRFFRTRTEKQIKWKKRLENWFKSEKWEEFFKEKQLKRAKAKLEQLPDQSGTIISEEILKFHDSDKRDHIRKRWQKRINDLV